jgi:hypothetical protein
VPEKQYTPIDYKEILKKAYKAAGEPPGTVRFGEGILAANELYWNSLENSADAFDLQFILTITLDLDNYEACWYSKETADFHIICLWDYIKPVAKISVKELRILVTLAAAKIWELKNVDNRRD